MLEAAGQVALPHFVDMAAVVLGAAQGALFAAGVAKERRIDLVGIALIAIATGLGGGIVRDLLLNKVPAALSNNEFLSAALIAALVAVAFARLAAQLDPLVVAFDALSLGLYLVVGLSKAQAAGLEAVPAVFVGILSCTAGGVIRDVLLRTEVAVVTVGSFYAFAAFGGALVYMGVSSYTGSGPAAWAAVIVTFAVRMLSVWFGWSTPHASALSLEASVERAEELARTTVRAITGNGKGSMRQERSKPADGAATE
jgi:uncharacterized membrane protein YeiH